MESAATTTNDMNPKAGNNGDSDGMAQEKKRLRKIFTAGLIACCNWRMVERKRGVSLTGREGGSIGGEGGVVGGGLGAGDDQDRGGGDGNINETAEKSQRYGDLDAYDSEAGDLKDSHEERKSVYKQKKTCPRNPSKIRKWFGTVRHKVYNLKHPSIDSTIGGYAFGADTLSRSVSPGPEPGPILFREPHRDLTMCYRCGHNAYATVESFCEPVLPAGLDIGELVLEGRYGERDPLEEDAVWMILPGFEGYVKEEALETVEDWAKMFYAENSLGRRW